MTIKYFVKSEVIVPSKGNNLSLWEIDFMFPSTNEIPLYPTGICWVKQRNFFRVARNINGKKKHILDTPDIVEAIKALEKFCDKHKIKP